jgi:hypothetical protein
MRLITVYIIIFLIAFAYIGFFASAYGDYFKTTGVYHKTNPSVCIMYPDESYDNIPMLKEQTFSAISEWQTKLVNATGGNWNMTTTEYPWSEHAFLTVDDYPECTVFINYEQGVADESVGRTGYDFSKSSRYYYWIEIDLYTIERKISINFTEDGGTVSNNMVWLKIPSNDIRNIILHEFGHGLGLEHYYVTSDCRVEECDYSPIMYSKIDVFEGLSKSVTDKDLNMTIRIYGEDGFAGIKPKFSPRTCDILCLEIDCGNSRLC